MRSSPLRMLRSSSQSLCQKLPDRPDNARLSTAGAVQIPTLRRRKGALVRQLAEAQGQVGKMLLELGRFSGAKGRSLVESRLGELEEQKEGIESAIAEVDDALRQIQ